jgi:Tol biopolymer transport system component
MIKFHSVLGDIWVAGKDDSNVQRITALMKSNQSISPNGQLIAFTKRV